MPTLTCPIDPEEPWGGAWESMRLSGWTWKLGTGLMTDYYHIKPGRTVKTGTVGRDYFVTEADARDFATRHYGWRGPPEHPPPPPVGKTMKIEGGKKTTEAGKKTSGSTTTTTGGRKTKARAAPVER